MKTILLNPGPVTLSAKVRQAMLNDDLCHREVEFAVLQSDIRKKILDVYALKPSTWAIALLTGSGTAAVEAMITSLVPASGKLLVVENGVYGERVSQIANRYGIANVQLAGPWQDAIDFTALGSILRADQEITHLAVVHHETTTGRLNNLAPLADLCRQYNVSILLDGVSSFGAEAIDFQDWPIVGCAVAANKCLHGVPGACFVVVDREALAIGAARNLYLDLSAYVAAQDSGNTPFTQSVQAFYALNEALDELSDAGGVEQRRKLYQGRMNQVRHLLRDLKIVPLLNDEDCSCVLHAYRIPKSTNYQQLHDKLKNAGFIIYAGQGTYATSIFRISMMGEISHADIERLGSALSEALKN
ncbi:MAG TPA: 2-aminoethylphosphonate aminotransferase [Gammaproteobacteria bacterium]|nr:2-aminoethylphosphonate aminotransferase [Gammaproteobacteria bacterium]|tara:strand:- start:712 stop:1788 length:1077 start_codon:yes stop_codon:yes gene_type:complete